MLIIGSNTEQMQVLSNKYKDKCIYEIFDNKNLQNDKYVIEFIEKIKKYIVEKDVVFIEYHKIIVDLFKALHINFTIISKAQEHFEDIEDCSVINVENDSYEYSLSKIFSWINIENNLQVIPEDKNKLTFKQLLNEDVSITEADVRTLKETQNKLKVGMLLQAKNNLNRVLKLTNVLDKLYDELVDRIDIDLANTDTASIMYTADYISKALQDTNKLIMDLINNDNIQNFFIIDNSQTLNIGDEKFSNNRSAINSREKIRKAAEIVLNNIDLFQQGKFMQMQDPNKIFVESEEAIDVVAAENLGEVNKIDSETTSVRSE